MICDETLLGGGKLVLKENWCVMEIVCRVDICCDNCVCGAKFVCGAVLIYNGKLM